jgi:predicted Zn-dependent peptidase
MRQVITEPCFDGNRLQKELSVIYNEYYDSCDDEDREIIEELMTSQYARQILPDRKVIGEPSDFMGITSDDLYQFMHAHYRANTMTLFVITPTPIEETMAVLESTVSAIPSGGVPRIMKHDTFGGEDKRIVTAKHQNTYHLFFKTPRTRNTKDGFATNTAISTVQRTLAQFLRDKTGCTYSPTFRKFSEHQDETLYRLKLSVHPEYTERFVEALEDYVSRINMLTEDDLSADLKNDAFNVTQYQSWNNIDNSAPKYLHDYYNEPYDVHREIEDANNITGEDIRALMVAFMSNMSGLYIHGPRPDQFPKLEIMQDRLKNAVTPASNAQGQQRKKTRSSPANHR